MFQILLLWVALLAVYVSLFIPLMFKDILIVESKTSSIPAVQVNNPTQSTFDVFGQTVQAASVTASAASASQQLFDAFSAPLHNPGQAQKSVKDSIMSMYASSPSTAKPSVPSPKHATFGDFATYQQTPAAPAPFGFAIDSAALSAATSIPVKSETFDPFNSLVETKTATSNQTFDAFASSSSSTSKAATSSTSGKPVVNLLDDFEKVEDSFGDFTGKSTAPLTGGTFSDFNSVAINSKPAEPAFGEFNDFTSASYTAPATATSTLALPEHSRASTGFGDTHSPSKGMPVNFASLPPIEDGWSSFQ